MTEVGVPRVYHLLSRMVVDTLEFTSRRTPVAPGNFSAAMEACREIPFPDTQKWFAEQLAAILEQEPSRQNQDYEKIKWTDHDAKKIVIAAAKQIHGSDPKYRDLWHRVLQTDRFSNLALQGLAKEPRDYIDLLGTWWGAKPVEPDVALGKIIPRLAAQIDDQMKNNLRHVGASWPLELRMKVKRILDEHGLTDIFP